jgi:hypothetical protein
MTDLIRLDPTRWPYSLQRLREDEPTKSFSPSPSDAEYAYFNVYRFEDVVTLVDPPEFDPATHELEQRPPVEIDGVLTQQWEIIELTPEQQEALYRKNNPPQWIEFWAALPPEIDALLLAAHQASPKLELSLGVGLGLSLFQEPRVFLGAWAQAMAVGLVPVEMAQDIQALAVAHHLPAEFVAGLGVAP